MYFGQAKLLIPTKSTWPKLKLSEIPVARRKESAFQCTSNKSAYGFCHRILNRICRHSFLSVQSCVVEEIVNCKIKIQSCTKSHSTGDFNKNRVLLISFTRGADWKSQAVILRNEFTSPDLRDRNKPRARSTVVHNIFLREPPALNNSGLASSPFELCGSNNGQAYCFRGSPLISSATNRAGPFLPLFFVT